jgi:adenylate cyclase
MAVFGVPFATESDAVHACNSALKMRASLALLNKSRAEASLTTIKIGIGINTGMVNVV